MGITDPAMATTAETPPFTTVDTDIPTTVDTDLPTTVDTDIPITVDTDTILIRTGAGNTPKVTRDRASRTSRLATGSSRRCARPTDFSNVSSRRLHRHVRSGVDPGSRWPLPHPARRAGSRPGQKVKTKYFRAVSCFEQIYFRPVPYAIGVRANLKR